MQPYSVLHIDRIQLFREGLKRILEESAFRVGFGTDDWVDGAAHAESMHLSLVIVDPAGFGEVLPDFVYAVQGLAVPPRVVVLTELMDMKQISGALLAGVDGYLLKDISIEGLCHSLQLVMSGEKVFPGNLALLMDRARLKESRPENQSLNVLSDREGEILLCLVNGHSNKVIASSLQISEGTVKVHVKSVFKKIGVLNRTQAAIWAHQRGIVANSASKHWRAGHSTKQREFEPAVEARILQKIRS